MDTETTAFIFRYLRLFEMTIIEYRFHAADDTCMTKNENCHIFIGWTTAADLIGQPIIAGDKSQWKILNFMALFRFFVTRLIFLLSYKKHLVF